MGARRKETSGVKPEKLMVLKTREIPSGPSWRDDELTKKQFAERAEGGCDPAQVGADKTVIHRVKP